MYKDNLDYNRLIEEGPYTEYRPYYEECYGNNYWTCDPSREPGTTIQQFAEQHCISYEAARRQVKRYIRLLVPHIRKVYNTQFLDDQAVELLESHLRPQTQPDDSKQVRKQLKKLSDELSENRINMELVQNLNQQIGALRKDKEHLKDTIEKQNTALKEKEHLYLILTQENTGLKIELEVKRKENEQQQDALQQLKKTIAILEEKLGMHENIQKVLESQVRYYRDKSDGKEPGDPFKNLDFSL